MKAIDEQAQPHAEGVHRCGRYLLLARSDGSYTVVRMDRQGFMPQRFVGDAMNLDHAEQIIDEAAMTVGGVRMRTILAAVAVAIGTLCMASAIWIVLGWKVVLVLAVVAIGVAAAAAAIWFRGILPALGNINWTPY